MLGFQALGRLAIGELSTEGSALADVGAFALSGQPALFSASRVSAVGAFIFSGQPASRVISMRAAAGAMVVAGQAATMRHGLRLVASSTVVTTADHVLFAPLGALALGRGSLNEQATTFVMTGVSTTLSYRIGIPASVGGFVLTFIDAEVVAQTPPSNIRIFPRVAFGMRASGRGGGMVGRASSGASVRARAFGG